MGPIHETIDCRRDRGTHVFAWRLPSRNQGARASDLQRYFKAKSLEREFAHRAFELSKPDGEYTRYKRCQHTGEGQSLEMTPFDEYCERAAQERRQAEATNLPQLRLQHLRAAERWEALADEMKVILVGR